MRTKIKYVLWCFYLLFAPLEEDEDEDEAFAKADFRKVYGLFIIVLILAVLGVIATNFA